MKPIPLISILLLVTILLSCNQLPKSNQKSISKINEDSVKVIENAVDKFVPEGYTILSTVKGNLNLDGFDDIILILSPKGEDTLSTLENPLKRKLLILLGQEDKSFILRSQNENVVYHYGYDLNFKDAFVDLAIQTGQFSVNHYGGFAQRWGRTTTFKYNQPDSKWFLFQDGFSTFQSTNPDSTLIEKTLTEKDFGKITFEEFDIYKEI